MFQKVKKSENIQFKKKNLKTLSEEKNVIIKILHNKFNENIWRFKKDQEVDNNFKKEFKKFKK